MTTHLEVSKTGTEGVDHFRSRQTERLLAIRGTLPAAPNGKPPRCSSMRGAYLQNEIGAGRMKPVHAIDELFDDFLRQRGSHAEIIDFLDRWKADLVERAIRYRQERQSDTPVTVQIVREAMKETQCQGAADVAQERVLVEPDNVAALEAFAQKGTRHYAQLGVTLTLVRHALSVKQGDLQRRVWGARRPA